MDVQEFLQERGLKPRDVENVFKAHTLPKP